MKAILWGINYSPEATGIAPFNAELAEYLAREDVEISVVTGFAYYPRWEKSVADRGRLFRTEQINGVKVIRCAQYVPRPGKVSTVRRIIHELSFGLSSLLRVLFLPRPDVYIVVSPPLFLGFCAWIATVIKRSRFVFHIQDLQPGAAVELGMVKGQRFIQALYALERFAYRRAAAVSGISGAIMDELERKGVPARKRIYFPNWLRSSPTARVSRGAFRRRFNIPEDHFLAVYSGNLGRKQGIDVLLETAQQLKGTAISMVIVGAGAEQEGLSERVSALNLPGLQLLPLLDDDAYASMLVDADVGLITQASGTGRYFFPSKLLTLLQAGLPVATVADAESELARVVSEGGFGLNVAPGRSEEFAAALSRMAGDANLRERLRERTKWVRRFSPKFVLPQFAQQLEHLVFDTGRPAAVVGEREPSGV
jgi:colanic acid biosynthesis glycosyl transferase WcaI